jgi:hypothetical protein
MIPIFYKFWNNVYTDTQIHRNRNRSNLDYHVVNQGRQQQMEQNYFIERGERKSRKSKKSKKY